MKQLIYAVEDDESIQEVYTYALKTEEYECRCFGSGRELFDALADISPDLVLLDIMLPGEDGFSIIKQLKSDKTTEHIPVIMVSAKGEELSKVKGLNMGADDYIAKPFGVLELIARIKANLRKTAKAVQEPEDEVIIYMDIVIDESRHSITANGFKLQTTLKEYNLLCLLCKNAEKVQERETIFNEVWGNEFAGETRTLDMHIKELRKKLSEAGSIATIQTIRGVGYILI